MSRICVKNLPKYVKEDRLREFFSQKGEVTDAKLIRTADGKSRQFGFIGFRMKREAEEALKFFNNTYMDTSRITCEIAWKVCDPNIPRPWSRYSTKKNDSSEGQSSSNTKKSGISENNDPKLCEFIQIMQPRSKAKLWANDTTSSIDFSEQEGKTSVKEACQGSLKKKKSFQLQAHLFDKAKESERANITSSRPLFKGSTNSATVESPEITKYDELTNMDYLKSRIKKNWSDSETDDEGGGDDNRGTKDDHSDGNLPMDGSDESVASEDAQKHVNADQLVANNGPDKKNSDVDNMDSKTPTMSYNDDKRIVLETGRLFIRNLPYTTNEDELLDLFSQFGGVSKVHLVYDKDTKHSKGIGYVLYSLPEAAVRALEELDNSIFQGRLLHVMPAKPQSTTIGKPESEVTTTKDKKSLKQLREEQKKLSEANGDTRAWNSLFMRPDTVVENIARKHGVSKSDFLDREANDLAVRIALGETQVVAETKKALSNAGVYVAALEESSQKNSDVRRSNHVILVKNLPFGSSEWDLANMFGKFGSLDKIILPPTKSLAMVIFLEAAEALTAFNNLLCKQYKDVPLLLEWAPDNILCPNPGILMNETKDAVGEHKLRSVVLEEAVGVPKEDIDPDRVESRSIFVKNLNFKTSDESFKEHFGKVMKCGSIKNVKVKKHLKNGKNLSMGFGFIEFDSMETATSVCRDLQGTILDEHALILQLCHAKTDGQAHKKEAKNKSLTKLIVRNVAFEATEKDLRQLFSPFGQIKSLRLPKKLGSHRGFAFVEYITKQEAQNALQALSSTHLYGRHLVLERAKEGEFLEELRERTAAQFIDEQNGFQKLSNKRKRLNILDEGNVKFSKIVD